MNCYGVVVFGHGENLIIRDPAEIVMIWFNNNITIYCIITPICI
jgi:hypothetical protein